MQDNKELLARIAIDPKVMVGKPVVKGTRLTVQFILGLLANGATFEDILDEYKDLRKKDIIACLLYASEVLDQSSFMPLAIEA